MVDQILFYNLLFNVKIFNVTILLFLKVVMSLYYYCLLLTRSLTSSVQPISFKYLYNFILILLEHIKKYNHCHCSFFFPKWIIQLEYVRINFNIVQSNKSVNNLLFWCCFLCFCIVKTAHWANVSHLLIKMPGLLSSCQSVRYYQSSRWTNSILQTNPKKSGYTGVIVF